MGWLENIAGKGENAGYRELRLFRVSRCQTGPQFKVSSEKLMIF